MAQDGVVMFEKERQLKRQASVASGKGVDERAKIRGEAGVGRDADKGDEVVFGCGVVFEAPHFVWRDEGRCGRWPCRRGS